MLNLGSQDLRAVTRAAANLPQSTTEAIFTISSPNPALPAVAVYQILGIVASQIQNQANNTKLEHGSQGDLCANLDIDNDAQGTQYSISGTTTDPLQETTGVSTFMPEPILLFNDDIELTCAASNTGTAGWMVAYVPLQPGAKIVAA